MQKSVIFAVLLTFTISACSSRSAPHAVSQSCPPGYTCHLKTKDEGTAKKIESFGMALLMGAMGAAGIIEYKNKHKNK